MPVLDACIGGTRIQLPCCVGLPALVWKLESGE